MEFDCRERGRLAPCGAIYIDLAQRNELPPSSEEPIKTVVSTTIPLPWVPGGEWHGARFRVSGSRLVWNVSCPGGGYGCERDGFGFPST